MTFHDVYYVKLKNPANELKTANCRTKLWLPTCPPNPANDFKLALPTTKLSKHPTSEFERGPS